MSGKAGLIIGIVIGILVTIILASLTVAIGCAVNGLTFGEQICEWFGNNAGAVAESIPQEPII